jgi:hypothetical protein
MRSLKIELGKAGTVSPRAPDPSRSSARPRAPPGKPATGSGKNTSEGQPAKLTKHIFSSALNGSAVQCAPVTVAQCQTSTTTRECS